jgi:hypothetical protein
MLTFSRKGSATGSCNKENNTVSAKYYTGIPFKPSRCSHFSHTHTHYNAHWPSMPPSTITFGGATISSSSSSSGVVVVVVVVVVVG